MVFVRDPDGILSVRGARAAYIEHERFAHRLDVHFAVFAYRYFHRERTFIGRNVAARKIHYEPGSTRAYFLGIDKYLGSDYHVTRRLSFRFESYRRIGYHVLRRGNNLVFQDSHPIRVYEGNIESPVFIRKAVGIVISVFRYRGEVILRKHRHSVAFDFGKRSDFRRKRNVGSGHSESIYPVPLPERRAVHFDCGNELVNRLRAHRQRDIRTRRRGRSRRDYLVVVGSRYGYGEQAVAVTAVAAVSRFVLILVLTAGKRREREQNAERKYQ